jgi:hypothetical protein
MTNSNIIIKDIKNNVEYFFNTFSFSTIEEKFDIFFKSLNPDVNIEKQVFNDDNIYCEIYEQVKKTKRGWVWNTKETVKNILYVLRVIPNYYNDIDMRDSATQTEKKQYKEDDVECEEECEDECEDECEEECEDEDECECECGCRCECEEECECEYGCKCEENQKEILIGTGYAYNPFSPFNSHWSKKFD